MTLSGNHDVTLDEDFYTQHGLYFHNQFPQDSPACINLVKEYKSLTFLDHKSIYVRLAKEGGPRTCFNVFGSPYSPRNGLWAFGYASEDAAKLWDQIPLDTDIVITHTPPKYHCDESRQRESSGCEALRRNLWRVRPSLLVCGHVHEGRGAERVLWDLTSPNIKYKEFATGYWEDPGRDNKKQSALDLSAKSPEPLQNSKALETKNMGTAQVDGSAKAKSLLPWTFNYHPTSQHMVDRESEDTSPAVRGQGGIPPSGRCDMEALAGRMDRKETCIINAAIMASSWPYKSSGGSKYNKPIVVDIDLPVWKEEESVDMLETDTDTDATVSSF